MAHGFFREAYWSMKNRTSLTKILFSRNQSPILKKSSSKKVRTLFGKSYRAIGLIDAGILLIRKCFLRKVILGEAKKGISSTVYETGKEYEM